MRFRGVFLSLLGLSIPVGLIFLILWPMLSSARMSADRSSCQSNLKQIALAYGLYLQDSNGTSPPLSNKDQGWKDLVQPYVKSSEAFQCPSGRASSEADRTDYFYNARLAKVKIAQLLLPGQTILFGDGYDNSGANAHLSELPMEWKGEGYSEARRHKHGANYAFVDGHIKWLLPTKVEATLPNYSFEVRSLPLVKRQTR